MIEVEYEGNTYAFREGKKRGYWIGISGRRNNMFPGPNCSVPLCFHPTLLKKAISDGYDRKAFQTSTKKKKSVTRTRKAKKETGIKIF